MRPTRTVTHGFPWLCRSNVKPQIEDAAKADGKSVNGWILDLIRREFYG